MSTVNGKKEKVMGVDLDPENRLEMKTDAEGYPSCKLDGKYCTTTDYLDLTQENAERYNKGKKSKSFGFFGGFGSGTLKKPYKINK
tara:strand:- start:1941 stop:2198 length:258 start_codon:yes stop_codon:yes gene_type:complete